MVYRGIDIDSRRAVEVEIDGEQIRRVSEIPAVAELPYISSGFFDIQVNGYDGFDYSYDSIEPEAVEKLIRSLTRSGTSSHLATIITSPVEKISRRLELLSEARSKNRLIQRGLAGIHLEGPFISKADGPRGAHDPAFVCNPDIKLLEEWHHAAGGMLKLITLAPELPGSVEFIETAGDLGILCAIGHTAADERQLEASISAGARLSTHLGNGSASQLDRLRNHIWQQAADDRLSASLICDGYHIPASVVRVLSRAKGRQGLVLISDACSMTGRSPGAYRWGTVDVEVEKSGRVVLKGTPYLAGAGFLLDWDIPRYCEFTDSSIAEALELCTNNPRRLLEMNTLAIHEGYRADITLFRYSPGMQRLAIDTTLIAGEEIYQRADARGL